MDSPAELALDPFCNGAAFARAAAELRRPQGLSLAGLEALADSPAHALPQCPLGLSLAGMEALADSPAHGGRAALAGKTTEWLKHHVIIPSTGRPTTHTLLCTPSTCKLPCVAPLLSFCSGCFSESPPLRCSCGAGFCSHECLKLASEGGHKRECTEVTATPPTGAAAGGGAGAISAAPDSRTKWFDHPRSCMAGGSCGESYVEQQRRQHPEHVGQCNVFISHAYDYCFLDVLEAVRAWEGKQRKSGAAGPCFYYFDLFINNQHGSRVVTFDVLRDTFGKNVEAIGQTLLVLKWSSIKQTLGRLWCVFELWTTQRVGACFDVAMTPADAKAFLSTLVSNSGELVEKMCNVDVGAATARESEDIKNIQRIINESGGFLKTNQLVVGAMQRWMIGESRAALAAAPGAGGVAQGRLCTLQLSVGVLLHDQGNFSEAEKLFLEVVVENRPILAQLRKDHRAGTLIAAFTTVMTTTLTAIYHLGVVLQKQGALTIAESFYREAFSGCRRWFPPSHELTQCAATNLALGLQALSESPGLSFSRRCELLDEAEELLRRVLLVRSPPGWFFSGTKSDHWLSSYNNLAVVLDAQHKLLLAESHELALIPRRSGETPSYRVEKYKKKALVKLDEASSLYGFVLCERKINSFRERGYPLYLNALTNLAISKQNLAKIVEKKEDSVRLYIEAEESLREAFFGRRRVLLDVHADTLAAANNLVSFPVTLLSSPPSTSSHH